MTGAATQRTRPVEYALSLPDATPTGYELGKAGWVSIKISPEMPFEMLREWIDESYGAVAPKTLVAQLADSVPRG